MVIGAGAEMGVKSYVALWKETSFGTVTGLTAGTGASTIEPLNIGIKTEIVSQKIDQIGINRGFTKRVQLDKNVAGTIEQYLHPEESVLPLAVVLGGGIVSGSLSGAFVHSISAGDFDTSPSSLLLKVRKGETQYYEYRGGRINQITITGNVGELIKCAYEFVFQDSTKTGSDISSDLSISSVIPFTYVQGTFRYAATEGSLTSTVAEYIQGFELVINNNIKSDAAARALGSNIPQVLAPTRREIQLKITQRIDTDTSWNRFIEATQGAVDLFFQGASISADVNYECQISMPKVFQNTSDPEVTGANEILSAEITYDVLVDDPATSTGKDIGITIKNATASY